MTTICSACGVSFIRTHACKAGICTECGEFRRNLPTHICPVRKLQEFDVLSWLPPIGWLCEGCNERHALNKNCNRLQVYKGVLLCSDCYDIPEIHLEKTTLWDMVNLHLLRTGRVNCFLCENQVLDRTGRRLKKIELHHIQPKYLSIFQLVNQGAPWEMLREELDKTRPVCVACHSYITLTEKTLRTAHYTHPKFQQLLQKIQFHMVCSK
jgi:hypothetical protein